MVNPLEMKKQVREMIIKSIKRDGSADRSPLVASLSLETGFKNSTIDEIIENMFEAKLIIIENEILTLPADQPEVVEGTQ